MPLQHLSCSEILLLFSGAGCCCESGTSFFGGFTGLLLSRRGPSLEVLGSGASEGGSWMGSMVVGVVVSAFLFTPFFVCHEHRHKRLNQRLWPVQLLFRITSATKPWLGSQLRTGLKLHRDPVIPLLFKAGTGQARNRKAQNWVFAPLGATEPTEEVSCLIPGSWPQSPQKEQLKETTCLLQAHLWWQQFTSTQDAHLHRLWGGCDDGWVTLHRLWSWSRWGWWLGGYWWRRLKWLGRHHCHDWRLNNEVWGDSRKGVSCGLHRWRRVLLRSLGLRRSWCLSCVWYRGYTRLCCPYQS